MMRKGKTFIAWYSLFITHCVYSLLFLFLLLILVWTKPLLQSK